MEIQLLVLMLALLGAWYYSLLPAATPIRENRNRKNYIIFICIILILQSALRHVAVGADTYAYYLKFEEIKLTSWQEIWENFRSVYVLGEGKDAGYPLIQKVFQIIFPDYRFFLFAVASFFFWTLGRFLWFNTSHIRNCLIAICLYQALFYGFFSITGIRQTIATSFTLLGYEYIKKRRFTPFLLLILGGALIHKSVLIFLPFYFIAQIKHVKVFLLGIIVILPIVFISARRFAVILAQLSTSENYMNYAISDYETAGAKMFLVFMIIIVCSTLVLYRDISSFESEKIKLVINACALSLIFTPLTWVDPSLMRVAQYYSIFTLLLLPVIIESVVRQHNLRNLRNLVFAVVILLLGMIIIKHNAAYGFLWENMQIIEY